MKRVFVLCALAAVAVPASLRAQTTSPAPAPQKAAGPFRPAVAWSAQWRASQGPTFGLSTVIGRERAAGIVIGPTLEASAGTDAGRLAVGFGGVLTADRFVSPAAFGLAIQGTLLRTWREKAAAPLPTTYAGAELKITLSTLKIFGGCQWRIGDAPASKRVRGVWGAGLGF